DGLAERAWTQVVGGCDLVTGPDGYKSPDFRLQEQAGRGQGEEQCRNFHKFVLSSVYCCCAAWFPSAVDRRQAVAGGNCRRATEFDWNPLLHSPVPEPFEKAGYRKNFEPAETAFAGGAFPLRSARCPAAHTERRIEALLRGNSARRVGRQ